MTDHSKCVRLPSAKVGTWQFKGCFAASDPTLAHIRVYVADVEKAEFTTDIRSAGFFFGYLHFGTFDFEPARGSDA